MKPADLILHVRQRPEWEAVDLGFVLVRMVWRHLFPAWMLLLLSIAVLCALLLPRDYLWLTGVILWWLKPLYDRVLLHILSRQIFGQQPGVAEVFSALPGLIRHTGLLGALSWRRLSFSRSYNLPIWQLEQLRGKTRKQRHELLYLQGHGAAIGLTFVCWFFKFIIAFSVLSLMALFIPNAPVWDHMPGFLNGDSELDIAYVLALGYLSIITLTILITEPFFVAAGFMLYLNRRTQLEAWDIEIAFRSMGERLQHLVVKTAGSTLLLIGGIMLLSAPLLPSPVLANAADTEILSPERLPVSASARELEHVMQADELGQKRTVERWVPKNTDIEEPETSDLDLSWLDGLIQLMASIVKYLIWAAVFLALILGFVYRQRLLDLIKPPTKVSALHEQPDIMFGMDIRPESLPDDIAGEARRLWQAGDTRAALSLLYRGTLMQLTRRHAVALNDSHTEGDILQLAQPQLDAARFAYLERITCCWQMAAYAHRTPTEQEAEPLFNDWHQWTAPLPAPEKQELAA